MLVASGGMPRGNDMQEWRAYRDVLYKVQG